MTTCRIDEVVCNRQNVLYVLGQASVACVSPSRITTREFDEGGVAVKAEKKTVIRSVVCGNVWMGASETTLSQGEKRKKTLSRGCWRSSACDSFVLDHSLSPSMRESVREMII